MKLQAVAECPAIVCGIDWFELAGGIDWSEAKPGIFDALAQAKRTAQETRQAVPFPLADCTVLVEPRGVGSGQDSHKEYCLDWRDVTIGISGRKHRDRKLHNFMVRVTGDACLTVGVEDAWDAAWAIVAQLGGKVVDEWIRRLDIAVDLPGVSIRDALVPAVREGRFVTTAKDWQVHDGSEGPTGFAFGKAPRVRVLCYDKKLEVGKRSPLYRQAMIDRRWGGTEPDAATRIEWQIGREWLDEYGIDGASQAMAELPAIAAKLTADGPNPVLRLTETVPDRENRHQDRVETLPLWAAIGQAVREWSGPAAEPLRRISRERIDAVRLYQMVRGCLTSYADYRGELCEGIADAHRLLDVMHQTNGGTDQEWYDRWRKKARASGTLDDLYQFPPADAV